MTDWTSGYVTDIDYTYGYYNELNPLRSEFTFVYAGISPPKLGVHCELGFGQGLSIAIHAAASGDTWYGNDFNPSQAAFAQSLASGSGIDAHLTDEAFSEFCSRTDLPDFDSIGLHGIWSWISDENRAVIVDFIRRKLKVGGALHISYNTLPGWSTFAPIQHLITEHGNIMGDSGEGILGKVKNAMQFAEKLFATDPKFIGANPLVAERFTKVKQQNPHYLAHEYFNQDWRPMYFSEVSKLLSTAKVDFACSTHQIDHIDYFNLTSDQINFLKEISNPVFRESTRDFMTNNNFRRDYWVKGSQKLSKFEKDERLKKIRLILAVPRPDVSLKVKGHYMEANLTKEIYNPIIDLMQDYEHRTIEEIFEKVREFNISLDQVVQVCLVMSGTGQMFCVQSTEKVNKAETSSRKLNSVLIEKARYADSISFLSSPVTAGGIMVNRIEQLFLRSFALSKTEPKEWAQSVWEIFKQLNQRLVKDGKAIETAEGNLEELTRQAQEFAKKRLPVLKALKVI
jgi:hypothetical protein